MKEELGKEEEANIDERLQFERNEREKKRSKGRELLRRGMCEIRTNEKSCAATIKTFHCFRHKRRF